MISIHLNKHNIDYVKHNDWIGTKLMIVTFTRKTHFHELWNTITLSFTTKLWFGIQKNFQNELLALQHTRFEKKRLFFSTKITLKCESLTFHIEKRLNYVKQWFKCTNLVKLNSMSWETLYNVVVYNKTIIRNAKSLQVWTFALQHTVFDKKKSLVFLST